MSDTRQLKQVEKFEVGKTYVTRAGAEVVCVVNDVPSKYPVFVQNKVTKLLTSHTADGSNIEFQENGKDVFEASRRVRVEGFVNVYREEDGSLRCGIPHLCKTKARSVSGERLRVAVIDLSKLELYEGDGLEGG